MLTNATSVTSSRDLTTLPGAPHGAEEQRRSKIEIALWSTVLVMIIMASLVGNVFVIACVRLHHRLREERGNIFLVNLSVTDMCSAAFVMSGSLQSLVSDSWELGSVWCDIVCGANYTLIIVSMMTLCFISLDRYAAVVHALRYHDKVTTKLIYALLAFAWFQGICFGAAPIYARWIKYDYWEVVCAIEWNTDHNQTLTYVIVAFAVCFLSPGVIMVVAYCKVMKVAHAHNNVHPQGFPRGYTNASHITDFPTTDDARTRSSCSTSPQNFTESSMDSTGDPCRDVTSSGIEINALRLVRLANRNHCPPSASSTNASSIMQKSHTAAKNIAQVQFNNETHISCGNLPDENLKKKIITNRGQYLPHRVVRKTHAIEGSIIRNSASSKRGKRTGYQNDISEGPSRYDFPSVSFSRHIALNVQNEEDDTVHVTIANIHLPTPGENDSRIEKYQPPFLHDFNTTGEILLDSSDIVNQAETASSSNMLPIPKRQSLSSDASLGRSGGAYIHSREALTPVTSRPKKNYSASSKAVRSLLIVVMAYFICMTPFSITKLYKVIVPRKDALPGYVNLTASIFQYCSSAINPLIYGIFRKDFQAAFILLLKKFLLKAKLRDAMDLNLSSY